MKKILFLFLDGVGLGENNPEINPFARFQFGALEHISGDQPWLQSTKPVENERSIFFHVDANLGVEETPQSATGQATIMTGINVPKTLGYHYGPKPNPDIMALVAESSVIKQITAAGAQARLLNGYPDRFLEAVKAGKRLRSSNQWALHVGGVDMPGSQDYLNGEAMSADFTGRMWAERLAETDAASVMWRERLGPIPTRTPQEAGRQLVEMASSVNFAFFDYWLTDYIGHRGTLQDAQRVLGNLNGVVEGILETWDDSQGLVIITSDHGNIEDVSQRGHTQNSVPGIVIGDDRHAFAEGITDLTGFAPAIRNYLLS